MSDPVEEPIRLITVTIDLPSGLVEAYDALITDQKVYPDRESAMLHGLIESWRHNKGSFHTLRLDVRSERDPDDMASEAAPEEGETGS